MSKGNLPFGFDRAEDSPGFLLWQTTTIWQRQIKKALDPYNISHAQFVIMATLMWFEVHDFDTTQVLIAQHTKLGKMTVSKSLKQLALLGFVVRHEHQVDIRAKNVKLTEKGREMVHIWVPIVEGIDRLFFGKVTALEQRELINILGKLIQGEMSDHD